MRRDSIGVGNPLVGRYLTRRRAFAEVTVNQFLAEAANLICFLFCYLQLFRRQFRVPGWVSSRLTDGA